MDGSFGWNAETFITGATLIVILTQTWGLWEQNKTVWYEESGESLSVAVFSINFAYFWISVIFGAASGDWLIFMTGLLNGPIIGSILRALHSFKPWTRLEQHVAGASIMAIMLAAMFERGEGKWFLAIGLVTLGASALQPYELWKTKSAGAVNLKLFSSFFVGALFWTAYGFFADRWVLQVTCPVFAMIHATTISLCLYYRRRLARQAA